MTLSGSTSPLMRYSYIHFILALFLSPAVSAAVPDKLQDPEFKKWECDIHYLEKKYSIA